MVKSIFIPEDSENILEIDLDISPEKNEIYKLLKGPATFIGQLPETDIVIMKCRESIFDLIRNTHILPPPFDHEYTLGPILLVRMDHHADHQPLSLVEYMQYRLEHFPHIS